MVARVVQWWLLDGQHSDNSSDTIIVHHSVWQYSRYFRMEWAVTKCRELLKASPDGFLFQVGDRIIVSDSEMMCAMKRAVDSLVAEEQPTMSAAAGLPQYITLLRISVDGQQTLGLFGNICSSEQKQFRKHQRSWQLVSINRWRRVDREQRACDQIQRAISPCNQWYNSSQS